MRMNTDTEKDVSRFMVYVVVLLTIIAIGITIMTISQLITTLIWAFGFIAIGMATPWWIRPSSQAPQPYEAGAYPEWRPEIPAEGELSGSADSLIAGYSLSGSYSYEANIRRDYEVYKAMQQRAGQEYIGYTQFLGVVRRSEASEYSADAARDAKEYTALMKYQGIQVQNTGKIVAAQLGLSGKEAQAFARQYAAEQNRAAKENAATIGLRGTLGSAQLDKEAKIAAAELGLKGEQAKAFAQQYAADQERLASMYASKAQKEASFRESSAKEYQARRGQEGQIGAAVASGSSEVVSKGFSALLYPSNMAYDYAYRGERKRDVVARFALGMVLFAIGIVVILMVMELAGFPILEELTNIVAIATGKAVGIIQSMTALADNNNIEGLQKIIADGGASLAGAGSSLFAAMLKKLQEMFATFWNWLQSLWSGANAAVQSGSQHTNSVTQALQKYVILPVKQLFIFR